MSKIYRCIGIQEKTNFFWRQGFTKGYEYEEADVDLENKNHCDENTLLLFDRSNLRVYVDRDQFTELKNKNIT